MAFPDGWTKRAAITIPAAKVGSGGVSDFSIALTHASLPAAMFDADGASPALNGGGDVRFSSDEAGTTPLPADVISFVTDNDPANGKALIRVKGSLSSATTNTLYVWWGNSEATLPAVGDPTGQYAAYDDNTEGYWPLTADFNDRTSNARHGTAYGSMTAGNAAGQFGAATAFNGSSQYIAVSPPITAAPATICAWVKPTDTTGREVILYNANTSYHYMSLEVDGNVNARVVDGSATGYATKAGISGNNWQWTAAGYDSESSRTAYLNTVAGTPNTATVAPASISAANIGRATWGGGYYAGDMADVQAHSIARSPAWITTEYNATSSPATFATAGEVADVGTAEPIEASLTYLGSPSLVSMAAAVTVAASIETAGAAGEVDIAGGVTVAADIEHAGTPGLAALYMVIVSDQGITDLKLESVPRTRIAAVAAPQTRIAFDAQPRTRISLEVLPL